MKMLDVLSLAFSRFDFDRYSSPLTLIDYVVFNQSLQVNSNPYILNSTRKLEAGHLK